LKKDKETEKTEKIKRKVKKDSSSSGLLKQKKIKTEDSKLVKFFCGCGKLSEKAEGSFALSAIKNLEISKRVTTPFKKSFARGVDQSRILNFFLQLLRTLLLLPMSFYGTGILSFGLYASIMQAVKAYILKNESINYFTLAIYVLIMLMSVPLLFMSKKSLSKAVVSSFFLSLIFRRALGVPDESLEHEETRQVNLIGIFIVGMLFGVLTFWINPLKFLYGIIIFIFAATVFFVPEAGIMISIYTLPFVTPIRAAYIVLFTAFAYLHKLLRGKRVFKMVTADAFVLVFACFIFFGGVFSVNFSLSKLPTMLLLCFVCEYFLIVNLIRNSEWLKRTVTAVIVTSIVVAVLGIIRFVLDTFEINLTNTYIMPTFRYATESIKNKNIFSEILILTFPFFMAAVRSARSAVGKIFLFCIMCIPFASIVLSFSKGAWLGLLVGILLFRILLNYKTLYIFAPVFAIAAVTARFLPQGVYDFIWQYVKFSDETLAYRFDVWKGVSDLIKTNFIGGIGNGAGVFRAYYPMYAVEGAESASNAYNLYLQLLVSIGLVGLITFVIMIFFLFCTCASLVKDRKVKDTFHLSVMICGVTSIISALAQGTLESIFINYRIVLLFFVVAGIIIASGRCMQIEDYNTKPITGPQATIVYKERKRIFK